MNDTTPPVDAEYIPPGALESISRAEIDIAISTARKYPQHSPDKLAVVKQNMMSFACLDVETAEACFYSLPRGGKLIQGPSVRLAEIAVACYGNLRAGTRIIETCTTGDDPHVVIQAVAMDLEKNIQVSIEKRRRIVKKKSKDRIDEDDINLATNACSAIAFRDSVYKVIPLALIKPVYEAAKKCAVGDQKTLSERRSRCLETFSKMGIQKDRVLAKLEKQNIEEINLADLELLIGLYTAIKDGEIQIDEAFSDKKEAHKPATTAHQAATQGTTQGATTTKTEEKKPETKPEPTKTEKGPGLGDDNLSFDGATPLKTPENVVTLPQDAAGASQATQTPSEGQTTQEAVAQPQDGGKAEATTPTQAPVPSEDPKWTFVDGDSDSVKSIKTIAKNAGLSFDQLVAYLRSKKLMRDNQGDLRELAESKGSAINRHLVSWLPEITKK